MKKITRLIFITFAVSVYIGLFFSYGFALNTPQNQDSFYGLKEVGVVVEAVPPEIEAQGLTTASIHKLIEKKLTNAGLKVLSKDDFLISLGQPAVYLNAEISSLTTEKGEAWGYLGSIDIALTQNVYLVRNPGSEVPAATWDAGAIGIFPDLAAVKQQIENVVDVFIHFFRAANESQEKSPEGEKNPEGK